jgi:hypothetical protein
LPLLLRIYAPVMTNSLERITRGVNDFWQAFCPGGTYLFF